MNIRLNFEKQKLTDFTAEMKNQLAAAFQKRLGIVMTDEQLCAAAEEMKTEINLAAFLDGSFIGGLH